MNAAFAIVAAVFMAAATLLPARAADAGPRGDVRAVRGDLPALLAARLNSAGIAAHAVVDDVTVTGDRADAVWHAGTASGRATLHRRSDRWWLIADADTIPNCSTALGPCTAPSAYAVVDTSDGGVATLTALSWLAGVRVDGRAPSIGEMPPTPDMNAYYFFGLNAGAATAMHGARLDVWFPYVLDANRDYVLWMTFLQPDLEDLKGTLRDNVLHFDLPDFTTIPGKTAFCEIDGA